MRFSHDYPKLQDTLFTTIRAGVPYYKLGQLVDCETPTTIIRARVLLVLQTKLAELSSELLRYDLGEPDAQRPEIIRTFQGFYSGAYPPREDGHWVLYLCERLGAQDRPQRQNGCRTCGDADCEGIGSDGACPDWFPRDEPAREICSRVESSHGHG